jgi:aminoglycoside phosphotransferase (APT) family kinase protein
MLVNDCAGALAAIHAMPKDELLDVDLIDTPDSLASLTKIYDALCDPHPTFDLTIRWLAAHRPEALGTCLVHGDFRLGNLLIGEDGLRAVLDWEIAHYGDPAEDLGWMCVRAWRFGGTGEVAGIGTYSELLDAYQAISGLHIPLHTLLWWEIYGTLRWGVICLQMGGDFRTGRTTSMEIAAIGRRVAENEYDLLTVLEERIHEHT